MSHRAISRRRAAFRLFFEDLLEHVLVQTQIGHQALELAVLLHKLPKAGQLGDPHPGELTLPPVEGLLGDPRPAAYLQSGNAALSLPERRHDLLVRERLLQCQSPRKRDGQG